MAVVNESLPTLKRCPADLGDGECGSAVFYDWGLELLDARDSLDIRGGPAERYKDWAQSNQVKICVRCTTPYVIQSGELVDVSAELSAEDVKAVLSRGQVSNPHPKIKDPPPAAHEPGGLR